MAAIAFHIGLVGHGHENPGLQKAHPKRRASADFETHHDPVQRFEPQRTVECLRCFVAPVYLQFERADSFPLTESANWLHHSRA